MTLLMIDKQIHNKPGSANTSSKLSREVIFRTAIQAFTNTVIQYSSK